MGGVPLMVSVLQDDRDDLGLLRGALECCVHAMCPPPSAPFPPPLASLPPLGVGAGGASLWGPPSGQHAQSAAQNKQSGQGELTGGTGQGSPTQGSAYQQLTVPHPEAPNPHAAMQSLESQVGGE